MLRVPAPSLPRYGRIPSSSLLSSNTPRHLRKPDAWVAQSHCALTKPAGNQPECPGYVPAPSAWKVTHLRVSRRPLRQTHWVLRGPGHRDGGLRLPCGGSPGSQQPCARGIYQGAGNREEVFLVGGNGWWRFGEAPLCRVRRGMGIAGERQGRRRHGYGALGRAVGKSETRPHHPGLPTRRSPPVLTSWRRRRRPSSAATTAKHYSGPDPIASSNC